MLKIIWKPFWYELDQSIVVGDIDYFYLTKDKSTFSMDSISEDDYEIKAEILEIKNKSLRSINGIITIGLDYKVYLQNGDIIQVNAEEAPGKISGFQYTVEEWNFEVTIKVIEETGFSSQKRLVRMSMSEIKALSKMRIEVYKYLLKVSTL